MKTLRSWLGTTTPASYVHRHAEGEITDGSLYAWSLVTATTGSRWLRPVR
jgi:hypothetical protein